MQYPDLTATYGALLSLLLVALSVWVIAGRWQFRIGVGDGQNDRFLRRVRSHANFIEYVPLILLLTALLEMAHASRFAIHALLLPLVIARVLHPIGMMLADGSRQQLATRGLGVTVTLLVLAAAAVLLLLRLA